MKKSPGPGKTLNKRIVRKVFGEKIGKGDDSWDPNCVPNFSTNIYAAWSIVEKMRAKGYSVQLASRPDPERPYAVFFHKLGFECSDVLSVGSPPHAICLAALEALKSN